MRKSIFFFFLYQFFLNLMLLNKKYGLVTAGVGGGQGIAGIIENIN
jgi:acetyl-CoA acyltransferase